MGERERVSVGLSGAHVLLSAERLLRREGATSAVVDSPGRALAHRASDRPTLDLDPNRVW